jgi:hypothetical protein
MKGARESGTVGLMETSRRTSPPGVQYGSGMGAKRGAKTNSAATLTYN